jgi:hypothetical protein
MLPSVCNYIQFSAMFAWPRWFRVESAEANQHYESRCTTLMISTANQHNIARAFLFGVISIITPVASYPAPITVPTSLNPGDQYRLAFVTSTTTDATSWNTAYYNAFVTNVANSVPELVALGTDWTAIGSTPGIDARTNTNTDPNISTGFPIYNLAGDLVVPNNLVLWSQGDFYHSINVNEAGNLLSTNVWTGTNGNGTTGSLPLGPASSLFSYTYYGHSQDAGGSSWIKFSYDTYFNSFSMYSMSGVLTVVPEPSTLALALSIFAPLATYRGRRG